MNTTIIVKPAIKLIGISTRTTNEQESSSERRLPELWDSYFGSNIAARIQVNQAHLIYALYTEYESDATGAYTALIGHEMDSDPLQIPDGLKQAVIPESTYLVFKTKRGPVQQVVAEAWGEIWSFFRSSEIERAYTGDFELYDGRNFNPNDAEIDIYIAIK